MEPVAPRAHLLLRPSQHGVCATLTLVPAAMSDARFSPDRFGHQLKDVPNRISPPQAVPDIDPPFHGRNNSIQTGKPVRTSTAPCPDNLASWPHGPADEQTAAS